MNSEQVVIRVGGLVQFVYNGTGRFGMVDKVGESKNGRYITIITDGNHRSFSVNKIENLQVVN
jgi:hypothetical protein